MKEKTRMRKKIVLICAVLILFLSKQGFPDEYYVSPRGADNNDGSESNPWKTIQHAQTVLNPGDIVSVKNGVYKEALIITSGGTQGLPIAYIAYPGHTPIIDATGHFAGINIKSGTEYIIVDGFQIENSNEGIYVFKSNHITIKNCIVRNMGEGGISCKGSHYISILNNRIQNIGLSGGGIGVNGEGIYIGQGGEGGHKLFCHDVIIKDNELSQVWEGIEIKDDCYNILIENNNLHEITNGGAIQIHNVVENHNYRNILVRNNLIYNVTIKSTSVHWATGIRLYAGCEVYNNVIYSIQGNGIRAIGGYEPVNTYTQRIYHNTIYNTGLTSIEKIDNPKTDILNNLGIALTGNLPSSLDLFMDADKNDFHLKSNSKAIDIGVDVGIDVDFDGNKRPVGEHPDLGAFEYIPQNDLQAPEPPKNIKVSH